MNKKKKKSILPKGWKENVEHITTNEGGKLIGTKNSKDFGELRNLRENLKKTHTPNR